MNPILSIITINYNNCEGLVQTVKMVLSQTSRMDFEYIIVDGNSSDLSIDVIKRHCNQIDTIVSEPDTGIYNAMNKGVRLAHGDYCLFMNSGDRLFSETSIESALPALRQKKYDFVIGKEKFANTGGYSNVEDPITMNRFFNDGSIPHQASFIKTSLLLDNPYDESFKIVSDWKFFIEELILKNRSYLLIDDIIAEYDGEGVSAQRKDIVVKERSAVLNALFPERVLLDYLAFNKGQGYNNTDYDKFYIELRKHNLSKVIYFKDVIFVKMLAKVKKSLSFSNAFSPSIKD